MAFLLFSQLKMVLYWITAYRNNTDTNTTITDEYVSLYDD